VAFRIFYDNEFDGDYTLTTNSEETNYPVENAQDYQLTKRYRATGDATEWMKVDAGSGSTITVTAGCIAGHNITSSATTIKIQGDADDSSWANPTVNESITHSSGIMTETFGSQSLRYWRFYIQDGDNPDTYISIGRLFLGTYLDISNPPSAAFERLTIDTSTYGRSITGQIYGNEGITYNEYTFDFPYLTNTERTNLETMYETVKSVKPIIFTPSTTDTTLSSMNGIITDFDISHIIEFKWKAHIVISEAL